MRPTRVHAAPSTPTGFAVLTLALVAIVALAACGRPADAALSRRELADAGFHLRPGIAMPANAVLHGAQGDTTLGAALAGKPALVIFTDYRCQSLCGVVLDELADALPRMPLALRGEYNVISLSLDSQQTQSDADAFRDRHTAGSPLQAGALFFTEDQDALQRLEASVGLVAPYDAKHKQFAHPAGLVLVDAAGRAQRILSPFALDPFGLKLALTETGAAPSLVGRALLLCYAFDAVSGVYTLRIERILTVSALATILLLGGGVGGMLWRERRSRRRAVARPAG